ncbi:uncharacterized protein LOC142771404 [Rhipicephalus microplus]|uniref:uncharacterized protein LOC142771404 n=1 Tax=Rhipicephalus microplus TaxID=6941 RepID=UPI003F6B379C
MHTALRKALLVLICTDIALYTAGIDVKQFFNQMQPIWTVKTTRRRLVKCEVDQVQAAAPLSLSLNRCVLVRGTRCDFGMLGVLDTDHKERMTIFHQDIFKRTETLLFMAADHSCGIFKVESLIAWDLVFYDLRLRNSSVDARPHPSCRRRFRLMIGNRIPITVYKPSCQRLLRQG